MDQNVPREHCQEITKYIVAGVETLLRKVRSEEVAETLNLFREVVYQPVLLCLLLLSKAETQEDRTLALNNVRLEDQLVWDLFSQQRHFVISVFLVQTLLGRRTPN